MFDVQKKKNKKLHECETCGYSTGISSHYKQHILTHTNYKPFKCSECQFSARRKIDLTRHKATCSQKPYKCDACKTRFYTSKNLNKHNCPVNNADKFDCFILSDLENPTVRLKIFKCTICGHTSSKINSLYLHLQTHSDNRPYKCNGCSHSTKRQQDLLRHQRTCSLKSFQCLICLRRFKRKNLLDSHKCPKDPNKGCNSSKIPFDSKLNSTCFVKLERIDEIDWRNHKNVPMELPMEIEAKSMAVQLKSEISIEAPVITEV